MVYAGTGHSGQAGLPIPQEEIQKWIVVREASLCLDTRRYKPQFCRSEMMNRSYWSQWKLTCWVPFRTGSICFDLLLHTFLALIERQNTFNFVFFYPLSPYIFSQLGALFVQLIVPTHPHGWAHARGGSSIWLLTSPWKLWNQTHFKFLPGMQLENVTKLFFF